MCPCCGGYYPRCRCTVNGDNYGCGHFLLDIFLICITGGLWLIWIFVREMRKR